MSAAAMDFTRPAPPSGRALRSYFLISALICAAICAVILITLLGQTGPVLSHNPASLFGTVWNPNLGQYGIIPMLYGSIVVMVIAMAIALPLGVLTAIYIAETRSARLRGIIKSALEVLAGIPSIVYGLIGVAYISVWVAKGLDLQTGRLILTAGLILAVMILPTILTLTEDAISNVPVIQRENARALGLYRHEVILDVVLPHARRDILAAGLLALGRALGETMAVMLVIGSLDRLPSPIFNVLSSGQTITSKLGRELGESAFGSAHFSALVLMGLILVLITLTLTGAAQWLINRRPNGVEAIYD
ncbi:phosphate ABC transporter permease subunit PstC [Robiginitomaculum antarcticum]|uniref:phosphate ABC transporter permease subunit PstC n=1 Tax=Robiginitomaculum antarcticum TaxID=437507 RepID=UPI000382BF1F|nr:phosphate ABC transporter permease subunit PstC [Robiginitomaculum antarcticum]